MKLKCLKFKKLILNFFHWSHLFIIKIFRLSERHKTDRRPYELNCSYRKPSIYYSVPKHSSISAQLYPSPWNPSLQTHSKEASVLTQLAFQSQSCVNSLHSSMSVHKSSIPGSYPIGQRQPGPDRRPSPRRFILPSVSIWHGQLNPSSSSSSTTQIENSSQGWI